MAILISISLLIFYSVFYVPFRRNPKIVIPYFNQWKSISANTFWICFYRFLLGIQQLDLNLFSIFFRHSFCVSFIGKFKKKYFFINFNRKIYAHIKTIISYVTGSCRKTRKSIQWFKRAVKKKKKCSNFCSYVMKPLIQGDNRTFIHSIYSFMCVVIYSLL